MASRSRPERGVGRAPILKPVFIPAAAVIFGALILAAAYTGFAGSVFEAVNRWILDAVGWWYALLTTGLLIFCIYLGVGRFGEVRLGPDHATPDYGLWSWFAMLFSAGMGIGLLFFAVAEPLTHFVAPPTGSGETLDAAKTAIKVTYFHWGMHAWAVYAAVGLFLAYFSFRQGLPLSIRSALHPLIGDKIHGPIGHAVDVFAIVGTLFGVATSLGFGVAQVNAGLNEAFGVPIAKEFQAILIALITAAATVSVVSGLDAGIKRLSEFNMLLALGLLVFVAAAGPTMFLIESYVENFGLYVDVLLKRSFALQAYDADGDWVNGWTIFYWGWWISWSPFVGMFIARISRGRTIREFVAGVLLVPSILSFLWMTAFGGGALHLALAGDGDALIEAVGASADLPRALFIYLEALPLTEITRLLAVILVISFFITSSDSGSLVIDIIASGGRTNPSIWSRVFWAVTEGAAAATLLLAGGLSALQTAAVSSALPFSIIIVVALAGLMSALHRERARLYGPPKPRAFTPIDGRGFNWRKRIGAVLAHPSKQRMDAFIQDDVRPALKQVCEEIAKHDSLVSPRLDPERAELTIDHGGGEIFRYAVVPTRHPKPRFALAASDPDRDDQDCFYRAEVHLIEGGKNYCIFGYDKDQIIHDVLEHYNHHVHYLTATNTAAQ